MIKIIIVNTKHELTRERWKSFILKGHISFRKENLAKRKGLSEQIGAINIRGYIMMFREIWHFVTCV